MSANTTGQIAKNLSQADTDNGAANLEKSARNEYEDLADIAGAFDTAKIAARLQVASPATYKAAERFWRTALTPKALDARMKELVLVALHATVTALDAQAVRRHVGRALEAGASHADILDVLITITGVGNHALYFALPILTRELQAMDHPDASLADMTTETQTIKEEFIRARGFWNEQRDVIARAMPEYFAALSDISTESWKNGTLAVKERELICIAIDCSVTHMFESGLTIHIRNALNSGASRDEILEVFALASVTGLEGYLLGADALFGQ